jgi:hypothetical protein
MREALGQPLSNISSTVLNKMVSKDVALNLRKYKLGVGAKTPSKRSKSRGEEPDSPSVRFENGGKKPRGKSNDATKAESEGPTLNNAIRKHLRDLDSGVADKISLLKMLVIKSDEADQNFNRLRSSINHGQLEAADR